MKSFAAGAALGGLGMLLWRWASSRPRDLDMTTVAIEPGVLAVRPRPSGELLVQVDVPMKVIAVFTASEDATEWILEQAPEYGTLYLPEEEHAPYILVVSPFFDPVNVGHFLYVGYHEGVVNDDTF